MHYNYIEVNYYFNVQIPESERKDMSFHYENNDFIESVNGKQ